MFWKIENPFAVCHFVGGMRARVWQRNNLYFSYADGNFLHKMGILCNCEEW